MKVDVLNWGPCVVKIKIEDSFHNKLLSEAKASRKKENLFHKLHSKIFIIFFIYTIGS